MNTPFYVEDIVHAFKWKDGTSVFMLASGTIWHLKNGCWNSVGWVPA